MIKKYDGKIGFIEYFMIVMFCIGVRLSDTTPILLVKSGLNAAWTLPIISGLIILIPFLSLLSLLKLYTNKNLIEIIYHLTGRFIGFVLTFLLLIISFDYIIVTTRSYSDILSTMFYLRTPLAAILIMVIVSSSLVAARGINIIGSLCWFTYPVLQVIVLLIIPMVWKEININYIFPLGGPGVKTLLKEGITHTTIMGEIIILTVFFPQVRSYKEFKAASLLGLFISILQISLFIIIYISTYGFPVLITLNYPYQQLTRLANAGRFATNMEAFFLGFWIIASSLRFAVYYFMTAKIFAAILKLNNPKPLLPLISIIVFVIGIIPDNFVKNILVFRELGIKLFWFYLISLPILLWIAAKVKGEYEK